MENLAPETLNTFKILVLSSFELGLAHYQRIIFPPNLCKFSIVYNIESCVPV